jgi:metal-sulfur cluster biosynthetic enzyme
VTGGDFYFVQGQFFANNIGQHGVASVGACNTIGKVAIPGTGYTQFGVTATAGNCYVALTHNDEPDHVVFRVEEVTATTATLTWQLVKSGLGGVTLDSSVEGRQGYNFLSQSYQSVTGGDFYMVDGQFFANNLGQRGVISTGACTSPSKVAIPKTGYTMFGVPATAGNCYVALSLDSSCEVIVFQVTAITGTQVSLDWLAKPQK